MNKKAKQIMRKGSKGMKQTEAMTDCAEGAALEMVVRGGFSGDRYEKTALECSRQGKVNVPEAQPG